MDDSKSRGDPNRNWPSRRCGFLNARSTEIKQDTNISNAFNWKASTHLDLLLNIIAISLKSLEWIGLDLPLLVSHKAGSESSESTGSESFGGLWCRFTLVAFWFHAWQPDFGGRWVAEWCPKWSPGGLAHHQHQASESYQEESTSNDLNWGLERIINWTVWCCLQGRGPCHHIISPEIAVRL